MSLHSDLKKEQAVLQKSRSINDPLDTYFTEKISLVIAKIFNHFGWSPNSATVISLLHGVAGAVLLCFNVLWMTIVGVILIFLSAVYDCADGQIARMSGKGSLYGRCFDGFADGVVYVAIYVAVSIRLMSQYIPFTDTKWSFWIFLVSVPIAAYFHSEQARTADYHKNMYMYLTGNSHSEFTNSRSLAKDIDVMPKRSFKKLVCASYLSYTKAQERMTPQFQKLYQKIQDHGGNVPEKLQEFWRNKTRRTIWLSNTLVFNIRTYTLFVLLFLSLEFWIFPFIVLILEPIRIYMLVKYERLAKRATKECFDEI